jgi:preprotein translocase subunit SecG
MKKILYQIITTIVLFVLSTITVLAQPGSGGGLPCDPDDPTCPLDTWVIVLMIIAVVFTAIHLHRKQKSLQA